MRVAWFTWNAAESAVRYGTKSGELTMIANATYAARNYLPGLGFHHVVKLAGLSAGTVCVVCITISCALHMLIS